MNDRMILWNHLRRWRTDRGFTLADLADLTGYSEAMLSRAERGERDFSPDAKVHVARCLGVRVSDLFAVPDRAEALDAKTDSEQ